MPPTNQGAQSPWQYFPSFKPVTSYAYVGEVIIVAWYFKQVKPIG